MSSVRGRRASKWNLMWHSLPGASWKLAVLGEAGLPAFPCCPTITKLLLSCRALCSNSSSSNVEAIFSNASENTSMSFCITYMCIKKRDGEKIFTMGLPPALFKSPGQASIGLVSSCVHGEPGCQVSWKHWHMELNLQYWSEWRSSPASLALLILLKHDASGHQF